MQMQLGSDVQIRDGLLAKNTLLREKPRLGFERTETTVHRASIRLNYLNGNRVSSTVCWNVRQVSLMAQQQTASVVFGETSSLTSEVDKNGKPITTPGADPNLDTARENVADVSKRNSGVYSHTPTAEELKNPQIKAAWEASQAAANESKGSLPGKYFFIRQEEVGKQRPSKRAGFGQGTPIKSYGPFKNAGGGDVPRGSRTYIDIYDK
jgi:hypothetical protein